MPVISNKFVQLFQLSNYNSGSPSATIYFTNEEQVITFGGTNYTSIPCEVEGFDFKSGGTLPTPIIRVSNVLNQWDSYLSTYGDLTGAVLKRLKVRHDYLDGQANADPTAISQTDIYYVSQLKRKISGLLIEWELSSYFDLEGVKTPKRQVICDVCIWTYRGSDCGYAGGPVATSADIPTSNSLLDDCSKSITGCKFRFGTNGPLSFSGFPGAAQYVGY
jgi:lambda family phage minor tail protein L